MNSDAGTDARNELVIQGMTHLGERFRPSDWAERLCGMMSIFGEDRHLSYSPYLRPIMTDGLSCVVVDPDLRAIDPAAYEFLLGFARDNELRMRSGRGPQSSEVGSAEERRATEARLPS
jgi:hypothetical protein